MGIYNSKKASTENFGSLVLILDKDNFVPGDSFSGSIILILEKVLPVSAIKGKIGGEIEITVSESENVQLQSNQAPLQRERVVHRTRIPVPARLQTGRHSLPFVLPGGLDLHCDYYFNQTLPTKNCVSVTRHTLISARLVVQQDNFESMLTVCVPKLIPPPLLEAENLSEELVTNFPDRSRSKVILTFPAKKLQFAHSYTLNFEIQNANSSYRLTSMRMQLHENIVEQLSNSTGDIRTGTPQNILIAQLERQLAVNAGQDHNFTQNITLPKEMLPTYKGFNVCVSYSLQLRLLYEKKNCCMCSSRLKSEKDIVIEVVAPTVNLDGEYVQKQICNV